MKVLVTGANGQLGRDCQKELLENSIEFLPAGSKDLDITNFHSVLNFVEEIKPDVILNCAAYTAVDMAETEPEKAFTVNGLGARYLAIAANRVNAILVHYSTDFVFDGTSKKPYSIADSPNPISTYGASKLLGEKLVGEIAHEFILIRTSWVFGLGNDNFPKKVIAWSKGKKELKFVTDQVASPTYTKDLARATLALLDKGAAGIFHVTNSGQCSRFEWASFILDALGWEGTIKRGTSDEFPSAAKRPPFSVLDSLGTPEILGYTMPDWKDATNRFLKEVEV